MRCSWPKAIAGASALNQDSEDKQRFDLAVKTLANC